MFKLIVISVLVAMASADKFAQTKQLVNKVNDDGTYEYLYETSNGILAQESGVGGVVAQGAAQWTDDHGIGVQFSYVADQNGYKPSGNFLPQGPPIPPYILKALAYMKEHPWADQDKYAKRKCLIPVQSELNIQNFKMFLLLLSITFLATTVTAHCPTTTPVTPGPPKCADYPDGYFINDYSNCQAYYFCPNATSPPYPGKCSEPYNFDQNSQLCNRPDDYACPSEQCVATVGDYKSVAIQQHNRYRSRHSAPNIADGGQQINAFAQKWADYLAKTDQFYHSGGPYGENLYKSWGGNNNQDAAVAAAIDSFYSEIKYYDFNNPGFSMQTGHFTQVVWKSSIQIGVGVATYPDSRYQHRTVVCINYTPRGNVQGQFPQNVLPPRVSLDFVLNNSTTTETDKDPIMTMVL